MKEKLAIRMCMTPSCDIILYRITASNQCPMCSSLGVKIKKVRMQVKL